MEWWERERGAALIDLVRQLRDLGAVDITIGSVRVVLAPEGKPGADEPTPHEIEEARKEQSRRAAEDREKLESWSV